MRSRVFGWVFALKLFDRFLTEAATRRRNKPSAEGEKFFFLSKTLDALHSGHRLSVIVVRSGMEQVAADVLELFSGGA